MSRKLDNFISTMWQNFQEVLWMLLFVYGHWCFYPGESRLLSTLQYLTYHVCVFIFRCLNRMSLPPANEVWGKVMFLHPPVCPQGKGGWRCCCGQHLPLGQHLLLPGYDGRACFTHPMLYTSYWNAFLFNNLCSVAQPDYQCCSKTKNLQLFP